MSASLGWDLGGAQLKVARAENGRLTAVEQLICPLWQGLTTLHQALDEAAARLPLRADDRHRLTMTGELADLFDDRQHGVVTLIDTFCDRFTPVSVAVYGGRRGWLAPDAAKRHPQDVASANWLASVEWLRGVLPQGGVLLDIGSTTTDLVPFSAAGPLTASVSDADRLAGEELVYSGVVRTPVYALARRAPFAGSWQHLTAELFATTADVYRLLGWLPEGADLQPSADGREKTPAASAARLARMFGRDSAAAAAHDWRRAAAYLARRQCRLLGDALDRLLSLPGLCRPDTTVVGAGVGRFLAVRLAVERELPYRDFAALTAADTPLASAAADCAPAAALALLSSCG